MENFRNSDVKKYLDEISEESTSPDRIKLILRIFSVHSSENKDVVCILLENGVVEVLVGLYNSAKGKTFSGQIANIFMLLSLEENEKNESYISDHILTSLCNINFKSNLNILIQCLAGIKDIAVSSDDSSTSSSAASSSNASLPSPSHFLSVSSSAAVLEKATIVLAAPKIKEIVKMEVLDMLVKLVDSGVLSQAAEFVGWRQTQGKRTREGGGGGGEGGVVKEKEDDKDNTMIPSARFSKAFEAFSDCIKGISLMKKSGVLYLAAEKTYQSIQENKFFPTFVSISSSEILEKDSPENFPLKFMESLNSGYVTISGSKLTFNGGWSTCVVDLEMNKGIYKTSVECVGHQQQGGAEGFGLVIKSLLQSIYKTYLYSLSSGTCLLRYSILYCASSQVVSTSFFPMEGTTTLSLELDADKHILYFFVNGVQIPHCVINVPGSVYFAFTGYQKLVVQLKTLTKLSAPTINPSMSCSQYGWR